MNKERLLNVAKALRESPNPERFSMRLYAHACDTPACALGHYAHSDLQDEFALGDDDFVYHQPTGRQVNAYDREVLEHFDFGYSEDGEELSRELFSSHGCGGARTALKAAEFIERWVAEREAAR